MPREEAIHESLRQDHQDAAIVLSSESTAEVANNHELELRDHVSHNEEEGKPWQGEGDFTSSSRSPKPGINAEIESILGPSPTPISGTMYNKENTSPYTGPPPSPGSKATTPSNRTRKSAKEANGNPKKIERGTKNTSPTHHTHKNEVTPPFRSLLSSKKNTRKSKTMDLEDGGISIPVSKTHMDLTA